MIPPKTKRFITRLLPFGLIWLLSGWVFLTIEYAATVDAEQLPSTAIQLDWQILIMASLAVTLAGFFTGYIELRYLDPWLNHLHFGRRLLLKLLAYALIFSGDVLNTTARIQGLCNSYRVDLIVSERMLHLFDLGASKQAEHLGEASLRGRQAPLDLFTVSYSFNHTCKNVDLPKMRPTSSRRYL